MIDAGHEETEAVIKRIEKQVNSEYAQAQKEVQQKLDEYLKKSIEKDKLKVKALKAGLITKEDYWKWLHGQIMVGKRWAEMQGILAEDYVKYAQIAHSAAFKHMPEIYAININYGTYQVEYASLVDTSFTLYDRHTIEALLTDENGDFIPAPGRELAKDIAAGKVEEWNKRNVQSVMTQSILQGESIPNMATRLAVAVGEQNRKVAIRNARTMATGVQNAGRLAAYDRAKRMGIQVQKQWLATLDGRTRHWHRELDGVIVENDEPFVNSVGRIMYPGDPRADAANIYNCRCTTLPAIKGFDNDVSNLAHRNTDHLGDMSYEQWKNEKKSKSHPIDKQDQIAKLMKRIYGSEYARYRKLGV